VDLVTRAARFQKAGHASIKGIASKSGLKQSNISLLLNKSRVPRLDTFERLLKAIGLRAVLAPSVGVTASESAWQIEHALAQGNLELARRWLYELDNSLNTADTFEELASVALENPPTTGNRDWDAVIAGLVDYRFKRSGNKSPSWTLATIKPMDSHAGIATWVGVGTQLQSLQELYKSDPSFLKRGVFFALEDLSHS